MVYENDFKMLAYYLVRVIEGDEYLIEDAYALLKKYQFVDEDGFWIND